ncbi:MAG: cysteine-rich small domain-containing protein [Prevotellaceae bacterium]|jgi:Zn-finger protein|nr:cysteine-rich small domain-containing protein [Prevotellaceae bacterium]
MGNNSDIMNYQFFGNKKCEYFPCHKTDNPDEFNCLFCYCPLYMLGNGCGGNFTCLPNGTKDCSDCILPHIKGKGYEHVQKKMPQIVEMVRKKCE